MFVFALASLLAAALPAYAGQEWFVAAGGTGDGSAAAPFGTIQAALKVALAGDTITVQPGAYAEGLTSVRGGVDDAPITLRSAKGRGSVTVVRSGRVLEVAHPHIVVDGLVMDGGFGAADTVRLTSAADHFVLRRSEVRRSGRDCIDMGAPTDVLLEHSSINHCLWWDGARQDAHAIVAGAVQGLTLRHLDIHTFSGDGLQLDPGRSLPGWDRVSIEHTSFTLVPLPSPQNGFPAGVVPGENAVDTKTHASAPRARLTITDTTAKGFGPGLITNMAAFNLKEHVEVTVDRVTVSLSEIAFRVRGPGPTGGAWVTVRNAVLHDVVNGFRYEDDIEHLDVAHTTFGRNVSRSFRPANSGWGGVTVRNSVVLGTALPQELPVAAGNLVVSSTAFLGASTDDYRLADGAPALDAAQGSSDTPSDRIGTPRPQGTAADVGAFERPVVLTAARPAAPTNLAATISSPPSALSVSLTWQDNSNVEWSYRVQRSTNGGSFGQVAALPANETSFVDTGVAPATAYRYRVQARNGAGKSSFSNIVSLQTN